MDRITKKQRSLNMSKIKSANTKPEIFVRKILWKNGFRYRLNYKNAPGKPDVFISKYKTAVFINGCFWHNHDGCKYAVMPKSNRNFWEKKMRNNVKRDKQVIKDLKKLGYKVLVFWECEIFDKRSDGSNNHFIEDKISRIKRMI